MANRLMQKDARPARPEYHLHCPRRGIYSLEIYNCLTNGFTRITKRRLLINEVLVVETTAAASDALLSTTVLLNDDHNVQSH